MNIFYIEKEVSPEKWEKILEDHEGQIDNIFIACKMVEELHAFFAPIQLRRYRIVQMITGAVLGTYG